MQAITIAIGKTGIQFFAQHYLVAEITNLLKTLKPPDRTLSIADFQYGVNPLYKISELVVQLSGGSLSGYTPVYQQVSQGLSDNTPVFTLSFGSSAFNADYKWAENYHWDSVEIVYGGDRIDKSGNESMNPANFSPGFTQLAVTITVTFKFDETANVWQIKVKETSGQAQGSSITIPGNSVLNNQTQQCSGNHVSDSTALAIEAIDFATPINALITGILSTIPGSGNLGEGIVYDFSLGGAGLLFPDNDGIQIAVKGGASYNGLSFSGDAPPALPFPAALADADAHHLNLYVSNYEVDALNWAFFKAGKLNTVVNAAELADPEMLKVRTYVRYCGALKPYSSRAMQAEIVLNSAPVTAFQMVYELSEDVMTYLEGKLPAPIYNDLTGLGGNNYTSQADLESDLNGAGIASTYYPVIEAAAKSMGLVVSHDITYTLVILDFEPNQPQIVFNVQRVDIMGGLKLGLSGTNTTTQTMQFTFTNVTWTETFLRSTIPKVGASAFQNIWQNTGESNYANLLRAMGKKGVPLPIMQGFQFVFDQAELSIQEGYISILADVEFQEATAVQLKP